MQTSISSSSPTGPRPGTYRSPTSTLSTKPRPRSSPLRRSPVDHRNYRRSRHHFIRLSSPQLGVRVAIHRQLQSQRPLALSVAHCAPAHVHAAASLPTSGANLQLSMITTESVRHCSGALHDTVVAEAAEPSQTTTDLLPVRKTDMLIATGRSTTASNPRRRRRRGNSRIR